MNVKKLLVVFLVMFALTGTAFAAEVSTTLPVSALVGTTCSVSTSPMTFSGYDGTVGVQSTSDITVACPAGIPYNIAFDAGLAFNGGWRQVDDGLGNTIQYGLYDPSYFNELGDSDFNNTYGYGPSLAGVGSGGSDIYTINGDLMAIGGPAVPGTYTDTVLVTVYY